MTDTLKAYILILFLASVVICSCAPKEKEYSFPEFHLTIKIPGHFIVQDSFARPRFLDSNNSVITDTAVIKSIKTDFWRTLLLVTSPDEKNSMSINIIPPTLSTESIDAHYEFCKTMQEFNLEQAKTNYDTIVERFDVGNIRIRKFITVVDKVGARYFGGFYIGELNNSYFFAKVDCTDPAIGNEFENVIKAMRF